MKSLFVLLFVVALSLQAQGPPALATSSLNRLAQNAASTGTSSITIYALKDETYSFQIQLRSAGTTYTNVSASTTGLTGPSGTISGSNITFYREQYVNAPACTAFYCTGGSGATNLPGGAGLYADGLMPFVDDETGLPASGGTLTATPFTVAPGTNQMLWIDVHAPLAFLTGNYVGNVDITSNQGTSHVAVTLHIWNGTLPRIPYFKSSIQSSSNRNDKMARELLRNRQSPAWAISTKTLESNYVDTYGLNSVGVFLGTGWYNGNCQSGPPPPASLPSTATFASAYAAHDPRLVIYNFEADEVYPENSCTGTYPTLVNWAKNAHLGNAGLQTFLSINPEGSSTAPLYNDGTGTGRTAVDIWTPLPMAWQNFRTAIQGRQTAGDQMWLYNVLVQDGYSPKANINWGSLDWRLSIGFISANANFRGWQQWSVDTWSTTPWLNTSPASGANSAVPDDGSSMYPGAYVGITGYAPSMRIKWSRDAINDNEYVHMLRGLGQSAFVTATIDPIAHDFATWTRDYTQVEAARITLGNQIEALASPRSATTFYVSFISGADANSGTDTAHPWKTLTKVTAGPTGGYVPGDTVKFNRGETWTSATFSTHDAGASAKPITYANYGTGALPILDGGGAGTLVSVNHNFTTVTGLQFQTAATLINFAGRDGITITGNTMLNATNHFIFAGGAIAGTTVVTGNTLTAQAGHAGGNNSIEIWADPRQGKSYTVSDNTIDRHLSNNPNANCIVLAGASNTLIERNICRGGTQGPGVKPYQNPSAGGANCAAGDPGTDNIKIRSNYVGEITTANNGDGELIEGEGCPTVAAGGDQTNLEVAYNVLVCVSGGVGVGSSDAIGAFHNNGYDIHGNVILGACQSGWPANQNPTTSPGMIRINAASTNVHVYNNTLVGGMPAGDNRPQHGIGFFPGSAGTAENNILKNLNTGVMCSQCGAVTADHNLFDTDVTRNYSAGVTDAGSNLNGSPMFVSSMIVSANDVKLQLGSPAIQSGATLGAAYKFLLDPAGAGPFLYSSTYDQSSGWMRGAFGVGPSSIKMFTIRGAVMSGAITQ